VQASIADSMNMTAHSVLPQPEPKAPIHPRAARRALVLRAATQWLTAHKGQPASPSSISSTCTLLTNCIKPGFGLAGKPPIRYGDRLRRPDSRPFQTTLSKADGGSVRWLWCWRITERALGDHGESESRLLRLREHPSCAVIIHWPESTEVYPARSTQCRRADRRCANHNRCAASSRPAFL